MFPDQAGLERVSIRGRFQRALRDAGIEECVWHGLRHTFANYLVMAGVNLTSVKELMGHKTITMTLRYAHLAPDFQRDAITRLAACRSEKTMANDPAVSLVRSRPCAPENPHAHIRARRGV